MREHRGNEDGPKRTVDLIETPGGEGVNLPWRNLL